MTSQAYADIETPEVLIDRARLTANIQRMAAATRAAGDRKSTRLNSSH